MLRSDGGIEEGRVTWPPAHVPVTCLLLTRRWRLKLEYFVVPDETQTRGCLKSWKILRHWGSRGCQELRCNPGCHHGPLQSDKWRYSHHKEVSKSSRSSCKSPGLIASLSAAHYPTELFLALSWVFTRHRRYFVTKRLPTSCRRRSPTNFNGRHFWCPSLVQNSGTIPYIPLWVKLSFGVGNLYGEKLAKKYWKKIGAIRRNL